MRQMSLFSAGAREPQVADLDGLLAGPGQVVRRDGQARISVVVRAGWRVPVLVAEMATVGLAAEVEPAEPGSTTVRSPWSAELRPVADAWTTGAVKLPPPGWVLDGGRLRWWCLAAGAWTSGAGTTGAGTTGAGTSGAGAAGARADRPPPPGVYTLSLGASDQPAWGAIGAALHAAGVPGVLVGPRADGPAYRIVGQRRLARLRELVGEPPAGMPPEAWPADPREQALT